MNAVAQKTAKRFFKVGEAATETGLSYSTILNWCRTKKIRARQYQTGKKETFRIPQSEIDRVKNLREQNLPV